MKKVLNFLFLSILLISSTILLTSCSLKFGDSKPNESTDIPKINQSNSAMLLEKYKVKFESTSIDGSTLNPNVHRNVYSIRNEIIKLIENIINNKDIKVEITEQSYYMKLSKINNTVNINISCNGSTTNFDVKFKNLKLSNNESNDNSDSKPESDKPNNKSNTQSKSKWNSQSGYSSGTQSGSNKRNNSSSGHSKSKWNSQSGYSSGTQSGSNKPNSSSSGHSEYKWNSQSGYSSGTQSGSNKPNSSSSGHSEYKWNSQSGYSSGTQSGSNKPNNSSSGQSGSTKTNKNNSQKTYNQSSNGKQSDELDKNKLKAIGNVSNTDLLGKNHNSKSDINQVKRYYHLFLHPDKIQQLFFKEWYEKVKNNKVSEKFKILYDALSYKIFEILKDDVKKVESIFVNLNDYDIKIIEKNKTINNFYLYLKEVYVCFNSNR